MYVQYQIERGPVIILQEEWETTSLLVLLVNRESCNPSSGHLESGECTCISQYRCYRTIDVDTIQYP